jgi:hypothetical protein
MPTPCLEYLAVTRKALQGGCGYMQTPHCKGLEHVLAAHIAPEAALTWCLQRRMPLNKQPGLLLCVSYAVLCCAAADE